MKINGQGVEEDLICSHSEGKIGNSPLYIWFGSRSIHAETVVSVDMKSNEIKDWRRRDKETKRQSKHIQMLILLFL